MSEGTMWQAKARLRSFYEELLEARGRHGCDWEGAISNQFRGHETRRAAKDELLATWNADQAQSLYSPGAA